MFSLDHEAWSSIFPKQNRFGALLCEFEQPNGWVESVCWSPSGYRLAFASHDSTLHFVQILSGEPPAVQSSRTSMLPFQSIVFLSDDCLVAAGYDANPVVYVNRGSEAEPQWHFYDKLDKTNSSPKPQGKAVSRSVSSIRGMPFF